MNGSQRTTHDFRLVREFSGGEERACSVCGRILIVVVQGLDVASEGPDPGMCPGKKDENKNPKEGK